MEPIAGAIRKSSGLKFTDAGIGANPVEQRCALDLTRYSGEYQRQLSTLYSSS